MKCRKPNKDAATKEEPSLASVSSAATQNAKRKTSLDNLFNPSRNRWTGRKTWVGRGPGGRSPPRWSRISCFRSGPPSRSLAGRSPSLLALGELFFSLGSSLMMEEEEE
ncbi:hypothetical protein NL676_019556 [Syzygium grande]|nr:hypothetical protein NL676_019556 [Syzygium grande]